MSYQTILVAFVVEADSMEEAQDKLTMELPRPAGMARDHLQANDWLDCWWVAEDERHDGSDCEAAVFVPEGMTQRKARRLLTAIQDA